MGDRAERALPPQTARHPPSESPDGVRRGRLGPGARRVGLRVADEPLQPPHVGGCGIHLDVELTRRLVEAIKRLDFDAAVSFYAPDAVWEGRASGMTFEGRTAIRGFWEDVTAAYEEFEFQPEETLDLGNGVIFGVALQKGRPVASIGYVQLRYATVAVWAK